MNNNKPVYELQPRITSWNLKDWNCYFSPSNVPMTDDQIEEAVAWLTEKNYPTPLDCPKKPESLPLDGGYPEFRPACLLTPMCRAARGMCQMYYGQVGSPDEQAHCATCRRIFNPEIEFKDSLSRKEFGISGMCQICQDKVFTPPKDDPCGNCNKETTTCPYKENCPV